MGRLPTARDLSPQKRSTAASVLEYAWEAGVFTASEAMEHTGFTRTTVIGLCDDLIGAGWLQEHENARTAQDEYRKGRPARRYALRADAGVIVGVDAGQHSITAVVADLLGRELDRVVTAVDPETVEPAERLDVVDRTIDRALSEAGADERAVLCLTLGVAAPTDADGNSPVGEHGFWHIMNPGYAEHFRRRGWTTIVENDANLAALAEGSVGAGQDVSSYITLLSGERFGAGYVVGDQLVRGARGGAGELRLLDLVENVGTAEGIGAVARQWLIDAFEAGEVPPESTLADLPADQRRAPALLAAADAGDAFAGTIADRIADRLARICAVLGGLLDIERIIIAGAIAPAVDGLLQRTAPILAGFTHPPAPELAASTLGSGVVSVGAVTRARDHVREHALELGDAPSRDGQSGLP